MLSLVKASSSLRFMVTARGAQSLATPDKLLALLAQQQMKAPAVPEAVTLSSGTTTPTQSSNITSSDSSLLRNLAAIAPVSDITREDQPPPQIPVSHSQQREIHRIEEISRERRLLAKKELAERMERSLTRRYQSVNIPVGLRWTLTGKRGKARRASNACYKLRDVPMTDPNAKIDHHIETMTTKNGMWSARVWLYFKTRKVSMEDRMRLEKELAPKLDAFERENKDFKASISKADDPNEPAVIENENKDDIMVEIDDDPSDVVEENHDSSSATTTANIAGEAGVSITGDDKKNNGNER